MLEAVCRPFLFAVAKLRRCSVPPKHQRSSRVPSGLSARGNQEQPPLWAAWDEVSWQPELISAEPWGSCPACSHGTWSSPDPVGRQLGKWSQGSPSTVQKGLAPCQPSAQKCCRALAFVSGSWKALLVRKTGTSGKLMPPFESKS